MTRGEASPIVVGVDAAMIAGCIHGVSRAGAIPSSA